MPARHPVSVTVENRGSEPRTLALEFHADKVDDPIRRVYRAANLLREIERAQAQLGQCDSETLALLDVVLEHQEPAICAMCKNIMDMGSTIMDMGSTMPNISGPGRELTTEQINELAGVR